MTDRTADWPALEFEERPWSLSEPHLLSRNERKKLRGPYQASIPASIASASFDFLDAETAALVDDASRAATSFDAGAGPELLPFTPLLLRSESAASSQIENLTASARAVALADLGDRKRRPNASLIVANGRAMTAAIELADQIDELTVIDMHRRLLEESQPSIVGHWRTEQNWIQGSDFGPHGALFVPPHPDRVPAAMHDLFRFIEREDLPVLAHAALAHAQFETIHPFPDGNGRTGRALIHAMLVNKGLVRQVTIPISSGILTDVESYFSALTSYREGDPRAIVTLLANATFTALSNATRLVDNLRDHRRNWEDSITARSDSAVWRIIDLILRYPVINAKLVEAELQVTTKTALDAIDRLVLEGVLTQIGEAKRNRKWQASAVLDELDAFAVRSGRRSIV